MRFSAGETLVFWALALWSPFLLCRQKTAPPFTCLSSSLSIPTGGWGSEWSSWGTVSCSLLRSSLWLGEAA